MNLKQVRTNFVNRTARKPEGEWAVKNYRDPKAHYRSFRIIMNDLNLTGDDAYCEVGCGGGVLLNMAMKQAKNGAAIDHSQEMVEVSIDKNSDYIEEKRLEIIQGNAESLPWGKNSFSACASANMFFFVENPDSMLSEVCRVLKPGGRFSMVTMGDGFLSKISFGWLYSLKTYSNKDMELMLRAAGFKNIRVRTERAVFQICYAEK